MLILKLVNPLRLYSAWSVLLYFLALDTRPCSAQKQFDTWLFGDHAGVTFNSSPPTPVNSGVTDDWEGVCSISDPATGALLFYTNGETVWDRTNQPMPNGTGLFGNTSSEQSALAIRSLVNSSIYYLFTVDQAGYFFPSRGLNYSVIDMRLNGGRGDVLCKNVNVRGDASEALQVIRMDTTVGYWVLGHEMNSDQFFAYALTSAGLAKDPVISVVGATIGQDNAGICGIATSSDGSQISLSAENINVLQLFKFNNRSGIVSEPIDLSGIPNMEDYLGAFSPSGRYYYSYLYKGDSVMTQFDLSSWDETSIRGSMRFIGVGRSLRNSPGALMLAPDRKIYTTNGRSKWLSVIENPDVAGVQASFVSQAIDLSPGAGLSGLPNIPSNLLGKPWLAADASHQRIVSLNADTIGGSQYLSVALAPNDDSRIAVRWNSDQVVFGSAFLSSHKPLQFNASVSGQSVTLQLQGCNPYDTVILQFAVLTYTPAVTYTLDSLSTVIVAGCLEYEDSMQAAYTPSCGQTLIAKFLLDNELEVQRVQYDPQIDPRIIAFNLTKAPDLLVSYRLFDALGRCRYVGSTESNYVSIHLSHADKGLYLFQVLTPRGQSIVAKIVR